MGAPLIFYKNLLNTASNVTMEGTQDPNYPLSNCYDYKSFTLTKYTGAGNLIEANFYTPVTVNCIAIVHHNIYQCRGTSSPVITISNGTISATKAILADGMYFAILDTNISGIYLSISIDNLGSTMPYFGELWVGQYLEYPYPLSAPFTINMQSKINTAISESGHYMIADYRYTTYTCKFEINWIDEEWYNNYHQPFLSYAIKGYPFVFVPNVTNTSEYYWARLKPNQQIPKPRSYAGIIDKISLDLELMKYEL